MSLRQCVPQWRWLFKSRTEELHDHLYLCCFVFRGNLSSDELQTKIFLQWIIGILQSGRTNILLSVFALLAQALSLPCVRWSSLLSGVWIWRHTICLSWDEKQVIFEVFTALRLFFGPQRAVSGLQRTRSDALCFWHWVIGWWLLLLVWTGNKAAIGGNGLCGKLDDT